MVLSTVLGQAMLALEPTARNSNLLPVKANGEVRLRSPEWRGSFGSVLAPRSSVPPRMVRLGSPFSTCSRMSVSILPRKIEMIAGGASLAPRRWSLAAEAIEARSRSAWMSTARMVAHQEHQELHVGVGVVLRIEQVDARVGGHRPVVVLARAVDAGERLLVQQRLEAVARRHPLERLHDQHLVIAGDVARLEQRGDLVLARRHLVVPGLDRHAEPVELPLRLGHEREHARRDGAEVVVLELLALGRLGAEERALAGDAGRAA